jgi:hypothetical protein
MGRLPGRVPLNVGRSAAEKCPARVEAAQAMRLATPRRPPNNTTRHPATMFADDSTAKPQLPGAPAGLPLMQAADLQDHLLVASNDLERLQRLLADAGDALMANFYGASSEMKRLQQRLAEHPELDRDELQQALTHLAGAITAMQFQDMASQLITHTTCRLRGCADRLANDALGADEDGAGVIEEIPLRPNPVTQDEMDAGSIELF